MAVNPQITTHRWIWSKALRAGAIVSARLRRQSPATAQGFCRR
jgi:hypothetical protein